MRCNLHDKACWTHWLTAMALLIAAGCGPTRGNKVGAFCADDSDCEAGICYNNICLDPDGDEDGDGLKNGLEAALGTDPFKVDTDGDGNPDNLEVVDVNLPADSDGDGIIDAVESSLPAADVDGDCLPDEHDPDNQAYTADMAQLANLFCLNQGVCGEQLDVIQAFCTGGIVSCGYLSVIGFEEPENTCDGADNDCDGETDEELTSDAVGICFDKGVCGEAGDAISLHCEKGAWVCEYEKLTDWREEETLDHIDGKDNDCDGETDEGWAGEPCQVENVHGSCEGVNVFKDDEKGCTASEPAEEVCDDVDNDCDGVTDEGLTSTTEGECTDEGACGEPGVVIQRNCAGGKWICDYAGVPGFENPESTCDVVDNDCDGSTDELLAGVKCDLINEHGTCQGLTQCDGLGGTECTGQAAAAETCDDSDNDCDGQTDEDLNGNSCDITNQYGNCPGLTNCTGAVLECLGTPAAKEICDSQDNDCDGQTDEDEICLKTATVAGKVVGGLSKDAIPSVEVQVFPDTAGFRAEATPVAVEITDAEGKFEAFLKPGSYLLEAKADGYHSVTTWVFLVGDGETMPLDFVMVPVGETAQFVNVCGRVRLGAAETAGPPIEGASVTLYGNDFGNALASTTSGQWGFYCISGVPGLGADGLAFIYIAMAAKMSGYLPGKAEQLPFLPGTVLVVNLGVQSLPADTVSLLGEDFESGSGDWTVESPNEDVGWNLTGNGSNVNSAVGTCVSLPSQNEDCVPKPDDPTDQCALCVQPTDPACIPEPGALPNAYSGENAFWFGNPDTNNFLPADGSCEPGNGGSGGPVEGSLVSPTVSVDGFPSLFLSFYSAFEIESEDPQAPPGGYDWMLIEIEVDGSSTWDLVGYLNPDVDANGMAYQPYSSAGFDNAPIWVNHTYDLAQWTGSSTIRIRFRFYSKDSNYNGFRGWLVDKVEILGAGQSG